jgi:dihydrofolate synthase/folylpolyglutamate synthase
MSRMPMRARERLFALEQFGIKLGLDTISLLLDELGRPDRGWPSVHIAGTNGKGSVAAMVERGLRAAGHRTGRYTSPHLDRIEERVAIGGEPVSSARFDDVTADVLALVDRLRAEGALGVMPTFFEVTTAMAFEIFRRERISVGVIEVGLGGRFDATNAIVPAVTAITSIALDHERHLGSTLEAIAFEKAGIIKPGVPVIVGPLAAGPAAVIASHADAVGAPIVDAGSTILEAVRIERGRAALSIRTPRATYANVALGLNGRHQIENALVAVRTLEACDEAGVSVAPEAVISGLRDVRWPARLEWLHLPGAGEILIDAAHNPAGAAALASYLQDAGVAPLPIVLAVMRDKQVDDMIRALASVASIIVATEVESARALPSHDLAERIHRLEPSLPLTREPNADRALQTALSHGGRVAVAGSIFLVGPLRARLLTRGATA